MPQERISLVEQVIVTLLEELASGAYPERLPGERYLAAKLQVSRPVLRSALKVLESQGWIQTQAASKSRMVIKVPPVGEARVKVRRVGLLISRPIEHLGADDSALVSEVIERCEEAGWECVVHPMDQLDEKNLSRRLKEIVETPHCDLWVGFSMTNYHCMTVLHEMGYKVIGVTVSNPSVPYGVITHASFSARIHAVGVLLRAGRKNFMMPAVNRVPEIEERISKLMNDFGIRYRPDTHYPLYDGTRQSFLRLLDHQFSARPRPDGIIMPYTTEIQVILLIGWLMNARLRYPDDLSVIQIGSDSFLDFMLTPVSHYTSPPGPLAHATFDAIRRYFRTGELLKERVELEMEYVKGRSV